MRMPKLIDTENELDELLSTPTAGVVETVRNLEGDIMVLGAGGKMGPSLTRMLKRAVDEAQVEKTVYAVSRFSSSQILHELQSHGIETIRCDIAYRFDLETLPSVRNIIYMVGRKFGSTGDEKTTWAHNVYAAGMVAEYFYDSRIIAFSSGNVYDFTRFDSGGSRETDPPRPIGEYAQTCLGRERMFEYFSAAYESKMALIRLNYAIELRYGVLLDIAANVYHQRPISLEMGYVNVIWQGDANAQAIQTFDFVDSPPFIINIAGPEILSIRWIAEQFAERFMVDPIFEGEESETALLSNSSLARQKFGPPRVSIEQLIDWIAHWVNIKGKTLHKPTHFEVRDGKF